jgi:NTE family protein
MKADLVCKGGGIKGIALIGAISYLEEYGYEWEQIAGTSAGAVIAALIAVGYTGKEIKEILFETDYKKFNDNNRLNSIPVIGKFLSILLNKGIYSGDYIEQFFGEKFKAKGKVKFKDILQDGKSKLKIIAADTTRRKLLILPDDLIDYNIDPMEFEIAKAVRMSISIPFYFTPVILKNNQNSSLVVDGGLVSNFPIWIFDVDDIPRWPTFGLNLIDEDVVNYSTQNINLLSYALDILYTSLYTNEDVFLKERDAIRIMNIPTLGIKTTDFNINNSQILTLYLSGYNSAKDFIENWNFKDYIKKYRLN